MALVRTGGLLGQVSGRIGGIVFSRNRFGSYIRAGTNPVTSTTSYALAAKARMTECTQAWQGLTATQRLAWTPWANANPVLNRLGETINLTGHAAYVGMNTRLVYMAVTKITDPPIIPAPAPLTTMSISADIGPGGCNITFGPSPTGADEGLYVKGCVLDSDGINYVENYLRLLYIWPGAEAAPVDYKSTIEARFGALQVDQVVVLLVGICNRANGQLSALRRAQATVIDTT